MSNHSTPTIQWNQPPVPREPITLILEHVVWILKNWRPHEFDHCSNLAYAALEDISLRLIDCDADRRSLADLLSASLTMNWEQDRRADRQDQLIRSIRDRLRNQPKAAA